MDSGAAAEPGKGWRTRGVKVSSRWQGVGPGLPPNFVPQATTAFGEPVGLGSMCPVSKDSLVLQGQLWDGSGVGKRKGLSCLGPC